MNQGRIWCVVNPTVGLPLLIGSAAATSLIVHACVLTHVTWFSAYWQGGAHQKVSMNDTRPQGSAALASSTALSGSEPFQVTVAPVVNADAKGGTSFVVTVTPGAVPHVSAASVPAPAAALPAGGSAFKTAKLD